LLRPILYFEAKLVLSVDVELWSEWTTNGSGSGPHPGVRSSRAAFCMEKAGFVTNIERWKELAALCLKEQDPAKLAELAREMNLAIAQKTPTIKPPVVSPAIAAQSR
jgi:hypothetical protein